MFFLLSDFMCFPKALTCTSRVKEVLGSFLYIFLTYDRRVFQSENP